MPCPNASHPRTGYDPRQHGADCDSCILGPNSALLPKGSLWLPVQPELRPGADILIVGRNPAERESDLGHPQVGSGGIELTAQLDAAGMPRAPTPLVRRPDGSPWPGVSLDNVIKCNPDIDGRGPKGAFERMTARWRSINARLKKKGLPSLKHPSECCRPTLDASLATAANVVVLGGEPLKAVTGTNAGIGSKKGGIWRQRVAGPKAGVDGSPPDAWLKLGATYDPSYVSGSPGERAGVIADLAKFRRFFEDRLHWVEPGILFNPMVSEALAFLDSCAAQPRFFYDMETDAKEPLTARTRCIGFGYRHPMRRTACWACNDRHTDNPQKVAFLAGLLESRGKTHAGSPCIVCDGSGYYETDFSCLLLTFTSVWPQTKLWHDKMDQPDGWYAGLFYTHAELKQLIAGVNKLFKAAEQARPKAVAGHRQPDGSFDTAEGPVALGHNCLYPGTPVVLGDGTSAPIDTLVRNHYNGTVKAVNTDGEVVDAKVIGWFRDVVKGQPWLVIRRKGEKAGARGLTLTPDHQVYTQRGRIRADEVIVGDSILSGERLLEPDERQALLGTILGDSTVASRTTRASGVVGKPTALRVDLWEATTATLSGTHVGTDHAQEKAKWLAGLLETREADRKGGFSDNIRRMTEFRTPQLRQIADIGKLAYGERHSRRLRVEALDQLGPVGLAWWFGDDGFKHSRPDRPHENALLAVCRYPLEDIEAALKWFGARFGPVTLTDNLCIRFGVAATAAFIEHISPYLLPSARYKLPRGCNHHEFVGFPRRSFKPLPVEVESIEAFDPTTGTKTDKKQAGTRLCLQTTEGNFLTGFGFVKNCNVYDRQVIESSPWRPHHFTNRSADGSLSGFVFSVAIDYAEDTLVDTRYVNPEGQKGLAAVGARFEDVTVWKEDHDGNKTAIGSKNDWELGIYCCFDVTVDGRAEAKMKEYVNTAGGFNEIALRPMGQPLARLLVEVDPYRVDLRAQYRHVGMHRVGVHVNQERRLLFQRVLDSQAAWHLKQFNTIAQADIKLGDIKTEDDLVDDSGAESDGVLLPFDVSTYDPAEEIRRMMSGEADAPSVNINSVNQLRTLIYEKWGIEKPQILDAHEFYTATGLASVGDNVLRAICADSKTPKKVAVALHHLRMAKRYRWKLSVTTLGPLSRGVKEAVDWKGSEAAAAGIRPAGSEERGYIWPDGCVRPSWSSRTAVWRDDCSEPNMMNIGSRKGGIRVEPYSPEGCKRIRERGGVIVDSLPERAADYAEVWQQIVRSYTRPGVSFEDAEWQVIQLACRNLSPGGGVFKGKLKSVFDAKPGMCLIGGDMDQLHLRIIANLYGIPVLLDAFEKGQDPHNALAYAVFGHRFVNADGWGPGGFTLYKKPYGGAALQMREAMKTFRYAIIYGAVSGTAWRVYVAVENDTGGLPNAGTEKTEIDNYYEAWRAAEPQWKDQFWDVTLAQYRDNALRDTGFEGGVGYLIEPVTGTRSGALEGGALCATANWTVLRVEAIIVRMAEANLSQLYPYKASALLGKRGANLGGYYGRYGRPDAGSIWDIGLNMNVHDFLSAQIVDESDGAANIGTTKWGKARLAETREALTIKLPGHPVAYSCDPGIGRGLHEV